MLLLFRTTAVFLALIQVSIFFPNLEEFFSRYLLMATSCMCENNVPVFNLNSNIGNVRLSTCSEAFGFPSPDHALQQNFKGYRKIFGGSG